MILIKQREIRRELMMVGKFWRAQGEFWLNMGKAMLGWLGIIKGITVKLMYRQRGRFSQSFVNVSMAGMSFLAILLSGKVEQLLATDRNVEFSGNDYLLGDVARGEAYTLVSDLPKGEITEHIVSEGETVSSIAQKYGVSIDTIMWENDLKSVDSIKIKQKLRILPITGIRHAVKRGETVYSIAKKYQVEAQSIVDYPFNSFSDDETFSLLAGQELIVPDGIKPKTQVVDTNVYLARTVQPVPGVVGEGNFMWPTSGRISQRYSWYHRAVDIASSAKPDILAAQGGTVVTAGWGGGYGNMVVIDHGNGNKTLYGHMITGSIVVQPGQTVVQGQKIGIMGSTGRSTGPHLHFEVITASGKVDPLTVLK